MYMHDCFRRNSSFGNRLTISSQFPFSYNHIHGAQSTDEVILGRMPSSQLFFELSDGCILRDFQHYNLAAHLPHRDPHQVLVPKTEKSDLTWLGNL